MLSFSSFDSIFVYFSVVLIEEATVDVNILFWVGSDSVDGVEGIVNDSIAVHHRY